MNYWIHRCAYQNGFTILDEDRRLTIGFSDCANNTDMVTAIRSKDGQKFDDLYNKVYDGEIWRSRWSLWYFCCEMVEGDIVVVPRVGGFTICKLKGQVIVSERRTSEDVGFEWDVEVLAAMCSPREAYATTGLLSKMKCRQTTINARDLAVDIESALRRFINNRPFSFHKDLSRKCHELLDSFGSPDHFERLLMRYFERLGGHAEILPKHYKDKAGDCDVSAVFPSLHLTISCQAKKHWGETSEWAVRQISDYAKDINERDPNWSYVNWVVSFASDFSEQAKIMAKNHGVVLINGNEFCMMLVSAGLGLLDRDI